jgi:hypothetical protein
MNEWRPIAAREIEVGDIVSVLGIGNRRSCIVHVQAVDVNPAVVTVAGRQPFGGGWRVVERKLLPESHVHRLTDEGGEPA